jgi:signal transduction histidine kinase
LYDEIASGRWRLSAQHAKRFLETLDSGRTSPYLERIRFGEALTSLQLPATLGDKIIYQSEVGSRRIRFRSEGMEQIRGFSINERWVAKTLVPQIRQDLDADDTRSGLWVYGGLLSLVVTLLLVGVVLLIRDVSRDTETNRSRAELVNSVSHELKTPITLVRLYSETLLRHRDFTEDDRLGFYRIIARESTRLGRLIDQVLTFSRVDRGSQVYHFEEGDLASVVLGVVEDYREFLETAGFRLCCHLPETLPPVRFDGAAVSQALVNLIDNATKYSGADRNVIISVAAPAGTVVIEVADRGIGIAAAEQARIFDRFYRVANGTGKGGYGLGLFLVRHIAEAHGGRAEVESEPGHGSRFRLILPAAASCPNPAS